MYKWAKISPQITTKLLECYEKRNFSCIGWWRNYSLNSKNADYYQDGLLDLQAFWGELGIRPETKTEKWNQVLENLGLSTKDAFVPADFPQENNCDMHGIPSLKLDHMRSCRKNPAIMPKLWELLKAAKLFADGAKNADSFVTLFDEICDLTVPVKNGEKHISPAFLSKILFISLPSDFVTIDSNTVKVFPELKNIKNGCEYLNACRSVKANWKTRQPNLPDDEVLVDLSVYAYFGENR